MSAAREPDQADFDLDRFIGLFDEALTSQDPRVMKTLRDLMMIVTLTRPEGRDSGLHDRNTGPLRRLYDDLHHLNSRLHRMEDELRRIKDQGAKGGYDYRWEHDKYVFQAAQTLAQDFDKTAMSQIMKQTNSGTIKGLK